ncbi:MAG: hypothetical protein P8Z68_03595 [Kineosporiaceae bacterium]
MPRWPQRRLPPYWRSVLTDECDPASETWTHLYVDERDVDHPELDRLLRLVADDRTAGVLITAPAFGGVYAPYDGGAEVHVLKLEDRDSLAARQRDWLPSHPSGL